MQAAESHCWCNSSASRNKNNGRNGGTADGMAESNCRRNGRMTGMAGMAERQKEWQMAVLQITSERRNGGKATYQIYLIYSRYTPTPTPTPTTPTTPFQTAIWYLLWLLDHRKSNRNPHHTRVKISSWYESCFVAGIVTRYSALEYIGLAKARCRCKLGNWESTWVSSQDYNTN